MIIIFLCYSDIILFKILIMRINVNFVTSTKEKNICFSIRREVFIVEQKIDEKVEMDDDNFESNSFIASINKTYVGTARCRSTENGVKLERFAVLKPFRGSGVGKSLIMFMLKYLHKEKYIYLHAQLDVIEFYSKFGFYAVGKPFNEADITHQKMVYAKNLTE